jgi:hypothetical protein
MHVAKTKKKISSELQVLGRRLKEFSGDASAASTAARGLMGTATLLAKQEGLYRTARTIHLDNANLRWRVEASSKRGSVKSLV